MKWNEYPGPDLPDMKRVVLMQISGTSVYPSCLVVGYFKNNGEGVYYVTPGAALEDKTRKVTHWCDCLGDDFQCPGWAHKTMNKT